MQSATTFHGRPTEDLADEQKKRIQNYQKSFQFLFVYIQYNDLADEQINWTQNYQKSFQFLSEQIQAK